jgi:enamine deaminase RidA (YjgF/YER057c/UK114 family)
MVVQRQRKSLLLSNGPDRAKAHRFHHSKELFMSIQRIEPGKRFSLAVTHGDTVYLAGQVADKTAGKSVTEQTTEILATIDRLLAAAGTNKTKMLMVNIWLTDIATFPELNAVWDAWVPQDNMPARATVEAKLAAPQYTVEIAVIAAK